MHRLIYSLLLFLGFANLNSFATTPVWLENDSIKAINSRIKSDFSITLHDGIMQMKKLYPNVDFSNIKTFIDSQYIEVKNIDGIDYIHRKSPGNFKLLYPQLSKFQGRGANPEKEDISMVYSLLKNTKGNGLICNGHLVKFRFSINVPVKDFLIGDTLRVWMPLPIKSERQKNIKILSASHDYILSQNHNSEHNTLFMSQPIYNADSVIHFEYVGEYETYGQYYSAKYISQNIKPYKKESQLYKKYTDTSHKHIIKLDSLANDIVGNEKCPLKQSELIYNYISRTYPWAGAREYSTIESLPQYVLDTKHGDCGQVSLLYISLMRTLGVPARWESGWMIHPWSKNLHDWAEVYFEGVGWVPVDVSFGRFINENNNDAVNYFSTGMDNFRFATNTGICSTLYPPKKYIRSETIDFQVGEVECSKGNLFYPGWKKSLDIISITEINHTK